jgi:hypothetical protein
MRQHYEISAHAAFRIATRFGIVGEAAQTIWAHGVMREARTVVCEMHKPYIYAPRMLWVMVDNTAIVTDGHLVLTAKTLTSTERWYLMYPAETEGRVSA